MGLAMGLAHQIANHLFGETLRRAVGLAPEAVVIDGEQPCRGKG